MNSYFVQHPEMILGEMKMVSGRFGMEAVSYTHLEAGEMKNMNPASDDAQNLVRRLQDYITQNLYTCLLYTSRCV